MGLGLLRLKFRALGVDRCHIRAPSERTFGFTLSLNSCGPGHEASGRNQRDSSGIGRYPSPEVMRAHGS
jgi:hypothetical protein